MAQLDFGHYLAIVAAIGFTTYGWWSTRQHKTIESPRVWKLTFYHGQKQLSSSEQNSPNHSAKKIFQKARELSANKIVLRNHYSETVYTWTRDADGYWWKTTREREGSVNRFVSKVESRRDPSCELY